MGDNTGPKRTAHSSDQFSGGEQNEERRRAGLAEVRHDLKNPINAILGYSEMLLEEMGEQDEQTYAGDLQRIHKAARLLLGLVDELLAGERLEPDGREAAPARPRAALEAATRQDFTSPAPGHLLVVDDNESNLDMLSRRLARQGHQVSVAADGAQALEQLRSQPLDLVLLDLMMPVMDGYETLQHIKADPALHHIPVLMLSALNELDSVVQCIVMGADDYLIKPYNPVLLRARIDTLLEKKRLRDQEIAYLRDVAALTEAAAAMEAGDFEPQSLEAAAERADELGRLARVFERMAREVVAREQRLRRQVNELRIEIDQNRKESQVAEITETDYFQSLQKRARDLRDRSK